MSNVERRLRECSYRERRLQGYSWRAALEECPTIAHVGEHEVKDREGIAWLLASRVVKLGTVAQFWARRAVLRAEVA